MKNIKNLADLQIHILNLEFAKNEHEIYLQQKVESVKERLASPLKFFNRITSMFIGKANLPQNAGSSNQKADWVNLLARVGVPFVINKLLFRKSGFVVKTLISLFSQGAIKSVNKNSVAHLVDVVTGFVKSKTKKKQVLDYGIPPDSETY